jgi:predicted AlkP superfamily phosphohydrolase/phosphomutase
MSKAIFLGIDGATLDLLLPWAEQGKLPNLSRILTQGAHGTLCSTLPPYSAQAWASMMTGKSPGKHGVLDFFETGVGPGHHAFISSALIQGQAIWDILSRQGLRVGIVNVPLTYPPVPVNGYMVSGFMTPKGRQDYTYPAELRDDILRVTEKYDPDPWDLVDPAKDLGGFEGWMEIAEKAAIFLHQEYPVTLYASVIQAIDQLQHSFWDILTEQDARSTPAGQRVWPTIEACYARMDEAIGRRLEWLDGETYLFLASDHGFQSVSRWFHVNCWLAQRGYLKFASAERGVRQSLAARLGWTREDLKMLVRRLDPLGVRRLFGRFARAGIADRLDDALAQPIDWTQTLAYSGSRTSEGICVNLRGRDPQGIVEPGSQYEDLRTRIIAELLALVDPGTGKPAVHGAFRREEVHRGEYVSRMPDILLDFDDRPYLVSESTSARDVFEPIVSRDIQGRHHSLGIFAALGPQILSGAVVKASILDVTPTILYALGLPIPNDMDGRVLEEIFTPQHRQTHEIRSESAKDVEVRQSEASAYSQEEEEAMLQRLRDLGYLS